MEQKQVNIAVKKIKEIEFFVNEVITIENPDSFNIGFELTTNLSLDENSVEMILSAIFSEKNQGNVFMRIKTSNVYFLLELSDFHNPDNNQFNIPDNILVTFLSLSISHTRALLAKNALGTKFAELYIPIVNPSDVLKELFGNHNPK